MKRRRKWGGIKKAQEPRLPSFLKLVGTAGFEPATPTPPVWCATRLRYAPITERALYLLGKSMQVDPNT